MTPPQPNGVSRHVHIHTGGTLSETSLPPAAHQLKNLYRGQDSHAAEDELTPSPESLYFQKSST